MKTVISAAVGGATALGWLGYVSSLPRQAALGDTLRDLSTLSIGLGVFLVTRLLAAGSVRTAALPAARVHR